MIRRRSRPAALAAVDAGERVLAWCEAEEPTGAVLAGTLDALYLLPEGRRIPWQEVQAADWERDDGVLTVSEVGSWGEQRPEHRFIVETPGRLLELVRERVTASVVFQRHVPVRGRRGVRVIARRAASGDREISWIYEYDEGVDPDDPEVRRVARAALLRAREEVGIS